MTRHLINVGKLALIIGASVLAGCGGATEDSGGAAGGSPSTIGRVAPATRSGGPIKMGMMPKLIGIDYFNKVRVGAEEAAKEVGIELTYDGPTQDKVELQVQMIDEWIALGYDVIAVAPNDPEVIAPALKRAKEAGIRVLTFDADANPASSGREFFVNQAPTRAIGETLVDLMASGVNGRGKTVIVTGSATAPNQNAWMKVMKSHLSEKYPQIILLETLVPDENQNRARQMTLDVLNAHPDLAGIWGITSVALPGAAEAVRQAGKSGKVHVTGLSLPSTVREYVKDGTIPKFVLWSPVDLGYLTVLATKRLVGNELKPGEHQMGRLKNIRVAEGEVILGAPLIFDRSNIDKYDF